MKLAKRWTKCYIQRR